MIALIVVATILTYVVLRAIEVNIIFRGDSSPNVPPVRREPRIIAREGFIVGLAVFIASHLVSAMTFMSSGDSIGTLANNVVSFVKGKNKKPEHVSSPPILMGGFPDK
jgi:hypothetical protein